MVTLGLDFLPAEAKPSLNETVVTSGHGGLLPAGIPVGRVSSITKKASFSDTFSRTEETLVCDYSFTKNGP